MTHKNCEVNRLNEGRKSSLFSETASERLVEFRMAIAAMLATHTIFDHVAKFALANPGVRLKLHSSSVSQDLIKQNIDAV